MHRRTFLASAAAASLARPSVSRAASRVLRFVPQGDLSNPDPVWTTTTIARNHGMMIWDLLYGVDGQLTPRPQMAAGQEVSDNGLRWIFTLRDGLVFHDGEKVRAADCVASIRRWGRRRSFGQKLLGQTEAMTALDDQRFEIRLTSPFPLMLSALGQDSCFIMPERIARTDPYQQITEYVGSGPFVFLRDQWQPGSRAAYARFDRYRPAEGAPDFTSGAKIANVDLVEWITMPDPATAAAALQNGEVDWVEEPLIDVLPQLRRSPGVAAMVNDRFGAIGLLALNHIQPPFDNPKLRRALLPAIDQNAAMQAAFGEETSLFRTGVGVFTPGLPMANEAGLEVLTGPRDIALARRLVSESGYKGERVVLMSATDQLVSAAYAQVMRETFERVGLTVDFVATDWGTLVQRRASKAPVAQGGWSAFCTNYEGLSVATPASYAPLRGNGPDGWFGWPTSPRLEALRDSWFAAPDTPAQRAVCEQMQQVVWDEVPFIPLGQRYTPTAARATVVDIVKAPFPIFWGLRKT